MIEGLHITAQKAGRAVLIVRATSSLHEEILKLAGAIRVVFPEQEMALRLAHETWYRKWWTI